MARKTKVLDTAITRSEAEELFAEYANAESKEAEINAIIEQECTQIRKRYQDDLTELKAVKELKYEKLMQYALENRDEFGDKKSLAFTHGLIGFRTGMPKLKLLKGFKWEAVTTLLLKKLPDYVRTVHEPAKDKLIADRSEPEVVKNLEKVGLQVIQDETFYVEPKKEEVAA